MPETPVVLRGLRAGVPLVGTAVADAVDGSWKIQRQLGGLGTAARRNVLARYHLERNVERLLEEFRVRFAM